MPVPVYKPSGILAGVDSSIDRRKRRLVNEGLGLENIQRSLELEEYIQDTPIRRKMRKAEGVRSEVEMSEDLFKLDNQNLINEYKQQRLITDTVKAAVDEVNASRDLTYYKLNEMQDEISYNKVLDEERRRQQSGKPPLFNLNAFLNGDGTTVKWSPELHNKIKEQQNNLTLTPEFVRNMTQAGAKTAVPSLIAIAREMYPNSTDDQQKFLKQYYKTLFNQRQKIYFDPSKTMQENMLALINSSEYSSAFGGLSDEEKLAMAVEAAATAQSLIRQVDMQPNEAMRYGLQRVIPNITGNYLKDYNPSAFSDEPKKTILDTPGGGKIEATQSSDGRVHIDMRQVTGRQ